MEGNQYGCGKCAASGKKYGKSKYQCTDESSLEVRKTLCGFRPALNAKMVRELFDPNQYLRDKLARRGIHNPITKAIRSKGRRSHRTKR